MTLRGAKFFGDLELALVDVEAVDTSGAAVFCGLDACKTDGSQAPDCHGDTVAEVRIVHDGSPASGDTAAEKAHLPWVGCRVDLGERDRAQDGVLAERGAPHEVVNHCAVHHRKA